jgi:4-hydroxy-tetrahydrodipicolinate reductase
MKDKIKVIVWGLGAMGSGIAKMVLEKEGLALVGVIDHAPTKVGQRLYDVLGLEPTAKNSSIISENPRHVLSRSGADVAVVATGSFLTEVFPQVRACVQAAVNVVTIAEEMAFPYVAEKTLAEEIDRLARANQVTVLGTGINPGFAMDFLPIVLTGVCQQVSRIHVTRTNDLSAFGKVVM